MYVDVLLIPADEYGCVVSHFAAAFTTNMVIDWAFRKIDIGLDIGSVLATAKRNDALVYDHYLHAKKRHGSSGQIMVNIYHGVRPNFEHTN